MDIWVNLTTASFNGCRYMDEVIARVISMLQAEGASIVGQFGTPKGRASCIIHGLCFLFKSTFFVHFICWLNTILRLLGQPSLCIQL